MRTPRTLVVDEKERAVLQWLQDPVTRSYMAAVSRLRDAAYAELAGGQCERPGRAAAALGAFDVCLSPKGKKEEDGR